MNAPRLAHAMQTVKPSSSTVAGAALGAPAAILVCFLVETYGGVALPDEVKVAIGSLLTVLAGFFFTGGRSVDTQD